MQIRQWGAQKLARAGNEGDEEAPVVNPPGRIEDIDPDEVSVVPMGVTPGVFPLRRGQKLTEAQKAEILNAGLPLPQETASLGDMMRAAATAAVEALIPSLAKLIRNQGEDDPMQRQQTPPTGDAHQAPPPAAPDEQPLAAGTEPAATDGEPAGDGEAPAEGAGDEAPAEPPAEAMVRSVATQVFEELFKPFQAQLNEQAEKTAGMERSFTELKGSVTTEMKRHFDGFRPGGQAGGDLGPEPEGEGKATAKTGKSNIDWNWN